MNEKIINVFFGSDNLPYKDIERQVHFPISGSAFLGASNTTKIRFYFDQIGNSNTTWVSVAKLPNGKQGSKVLSISEDSELGENYAELQLDSWYTQAKGDVYIALQGYQGGVEYSYDSETELYEITGTPTIQTTGSIKLAINYAPIGQVADYNDEFTTYQEILAALGDKADISSTIIVVNDITQVVATTYEDGQLFYNLADRKLYQLDNSSFVVFQPYVVISSNPIPQSDFDIILAHKEYPILNGGYVFWYYGEDTTALRYARNDLNVSSNTFTATKQQVIILKNTRNYNLFTENAETYKKSKIDTELSGKADKSTTYTKTETDDLLSGKQNTLVSGTNIKSLTVDGVEKSLLGSGTIEVGASSGGGAWGEITGDIQDQTDLQAEFQNVREVAEGKCKTLIIRYSTTAPTTDLGAQLYKKVDGTSFTNLADFNSYIGARTIANASFNSQNNGLTLSNYYIIGEDLIAYRDSDLPSIFNAGDIILVIETDVPDRWIQVLFSNIGFYNKLETSKIDLDNYATKTEVAQKSDLSNIAPEYDSDTSYAIGDKVIYNGKLYTCTTAITTPESWDSTHWTQISVASGFVDLDKAQVITGTKTLESVDFIKTSSRLGSYYATIRASAFNSFTVSYYQGTDFVKDYIYFGYNTITSYNPIIPNATNTLDLGTSTYQWKDLYLSGTAYANTLSVKGGDTANELKITSSGYNGLISLAGTNILQIGGNTFYPYSNNAYSLGIDNRKFLNAYINNMRGLGGILTRNVNDNYGVQIPNTVGWTANKEIATTDSFGLPHISPSSTTLTSDEVSIIANSGAIIDTQLSLGGNTYGSITLFKPFLFNNAYWGMGVFGRNRYARLKYYSINSSNVFSFSSITGISLEDVSSFNSKDVPAYPANANWKGEWYGTQAEYDALSSYDSNTTYYILES